MNSRMENLCFLCRCLSPFVEGEAIRRQLQSADWQGVVALANNYFLAPALWAGLDLKGLSTDLDPQLAGYLESVFKLNAKRNRALLRQLEDLAAALNAADIEPLLLKGGAAIASGFFPRLDERFMVDLDVWVGEEKIDAAEQALFALGYLRVFETYLDLAHRLFGLPLSADLAPGAAARWCAGAALLPYRISSGRFRAVLRWQRLTARAIRLVGSSLSRETIVHRYPTHNSRHVWMNRLRHIGYLLRKYRDPGTRRMRLEQLAQGCRDWA